MCSIAVDGLPGNYLAYSKGQGSGKYKNSPYASQDVMIVIANIFSLLTIVL